MECNVDNCEQEATINLQKALIKWRINEDGDYIGPEVLDTIDQLNLFFCEKHFEEWKNGER